MKNIINNIKGNYKLVVGTLIFGILFGWLIFHSESKQASVPDQIEGHKGHDHESKDPTIWTCSMHPQIKQDKPGDCPICGMDLIPLSSMQPTGEDVSPKELVMSEPAAKLADIQTTVVSKGNARKSVYLQGKVQVDERRMAELTARFGGRIEKLFVNFTGQQVKKGERLATIYSPALVTAQRELLEANSFKESRPSLYDAAKGKLKLWDLNDEQIASIEEKGEPLLYFDILSPMTGTVMMRQVALGDYVKEGTTLFKLINLSTVWVMFNAYESDLPWIKVGDPVDISVQALPGKKFKAKVTYIDPFIDAMTRVAQVRVELPNKKEQLKPEMFAGGIVQSEIAKNDDEILIPKSSILWTGKRAVVYVKVTERENPTFLYREIVLGPEAGNFYIVEEGLQEGEEIAVNGVFKIDAASQLQGLPSMMNSGGGAVPVGHNHGGMDTKGSTGSHTPTMNMTKQQDNISRTFKTQLTDVYQAYLKMKNAFVASDTRQVSNTAEGVKKAINAADMGLLKGEAHMVWMKQLNPLQQAINSISKTSDIEVQRTAFAKFNLTFYESIKAFGLNNTTTYYQYCPMANSDKGAYWLSSTEEIRNPYFGETMLGCGETREILK